MRYAEAWIDYEASDGHLSLSIYAGDAWGNTVLPSAIRQFMDVRPEIDIRLDVIGSDARMLGLAAGDYELSYGISLPLHERLGKVEFVPMLTAPYLIYGATDHPLRKLKGRLGDEALRRYGWVKHKFEYDHEPACWHRTGRRYDMNTNTMLSTLEIVRQSQLLISTLELFKPLFARHDVHGIAPAPLSDQHVSGPHRMKGDGFTSAAAEAFAVFCAEHCRTLNFAYDEHV